jgi:hypothetical protein
MFVRVMLCLGRGEADKLSVLESDIFGLGLRSNPISYNPIENSNAKRKAINMCVGGQKYSTYILLQVEQIWTGYCSVPPAEVN